MNIFSWIFVCALALGTAVQGWLIWRQIRFVLAHRQEVPEAFRGIISLEAHRKAADYTAARARFHLPELFVASGILIFWTLGGGISWLDRFWSSALTLSPLWSGVAFLVSFFLINTLLDLPFSLYRTFVIERRFGFNRTTPGVFVGDQVKGILLLLVLGVPLSALVLWLMKESGEAWWMYVWGVWTAFTLLMMWAFPTFIAPLFNTFSPLSDDGLRERIQALLERCGFTSKGIFVMDGSRRSSHGNAYFTGFGSNKRIVFFDTLIQSLSPSEIVAVLAHELGHFKKKHVQKSLIWMSLFSLAGLALLGYLKEQSWFFAGLGVEQPSVHAALILFLEVMPVFTLLLQPMSTHLSRKREFEADDFASEQANAQDLSRALVKMYEENASSLTPDPLYSAFYDSHPPAPVRVAYLESKSSVKTPETMANGMVTSIP